MFFRRMSKTIAIISVLVILQFSLSAARSDNIVKGKYGLEMEKSIAEQPANDYRLSKQGKTLLQQYNLGKDLQVAGGVGLFLILGIYVGSMFTAVGLLPGLLIVALLPLVCSGAMFGYGTQYVNDALEEKEERLEKLRKNKGFSK